MRARLLESTGVEPQAPKAADSAVLLRHWHDVQYQVRSLESKIGAAESLRKGTVIRHVRFAYD